MYNFFETVKRTAANEQNVGGVNVDCLLLWVFAPALGRDAGNSSLQNFQKCLLNAFAAYVTGNRLIFRLAGNLIDFIDIDNAPLRFENVVIRCLNKPQQDILHVFSHIAGLSQSSGVRNGKRHIQQLSQRLSKIGFPYACRPQKQHVAFGNFHCVIGKINALIMVVDSYRKCHLGSILTHHIFIQLLLDLLRLRKENAHFLFIASAFF